MRARKKKVIHNALQKSISDIEDMKKDLLRLKKDLEYIGYHIISEWYDSYSERHIYDPYGSLFDAYKIEINAEKGFGSIRFSSDFINVPHHQSNEIIFNNAFIFGFHGGSAGKDLIDDAPWLRTPHPFYSEWLHPAKYTFSPYEKIYDEMVTRIKETEEIINMRKNKIIERLKPYFE